MNYFKKLPTITYQGQIAKNLVARAKLSDETKSQDLIFQRHVLDPQDRTDNIAFDYYDSPGYSWLVNFSNETVDPYYDYVIPEKEFNEYLITKYGSLEIAQRKIVGWRVRWGAFDRTATPEEFERLGVFKKYFTPVLDADLQVKEYAQKALQTQVSTNIVVELTLQDVDGEFTLEEEVRQSFNLYGFATSKLTNNKIIVQNVVEIGGMFQVGGLVVGAQSGAFGVVSEVNIIAQPLSDEEVGVWEPLTAYDFEFEENEKKKNIKLLDARYRDRAEAELKRTMSTR